MKIKATWEQVEALCGNNGDLIIFEDNDPVGVFYFRSYGLEVWLLDPKVTKAMFLVRWPTAKPVKNISA